MLVGTWQGVFVYARCGTYILHYMIYILWLTYIIGAYFLSEVLLSNSQMMLLPAAELSFDLCVSLREPCYRNKFMEHVSIPNRRMLNPADGDMHPFD
jgi:hypothetical protein